MIQQLLESLTLAENKIFKMASFFKEMINMHRTKMKLGIDLLIEISNLSISSKICNYCEDQDIQDCVL